MAKGYMYVCMYVYFFFLPVYRLYATRGVMTDFMYTYVIIRRKEKKKTRGGGKGGVSFFFPLFFLQTFPLHPNSIKLTYICYHMEKDQLILFFT